MDPDLAALERAVRAEPGDASLKTRLAHAYAQAGRPAEAYLTWLDLEREPPAAVTEAAFVAQEDTLRGLVGWCQVLGVGAGGDRFVDPQVLLDARRPISAADLTGGLGWGAEDAVSEIARLQTLGLLRLPCDEVEPPLEILALLPNLYSLDLQGERLDDMALEPLRRLRSLRSLTLSSTRLRDDWPRWLAGSKVLVFEGRLPSLGDAGIEALSGVHSLLGIRLECGVDVTDAGLRALASLPCLASLDLFVGEQVRGSFLSAFAAHPLKGLSLSGGTIDPQTLRVLANLPSLRTLRVPIADNDLLEALGTSSIQALQLTQTAPALDDAGLTALGRSSALRRLALGWSSGVTGVGFKAWAPGLIELSGSAGFDDDGARALQHLTTLEVVDLEHAERLTDEGLAALATLPSLRSLTITGEVTDLGLRTLHRHPSLQSLTVKEGITGPHLTEGALDELVATVPGLEVFRQGFY